MRAAIWHGVGEFRVEDVPTPELKSDGEVLLRVEVVYFGAKVVRAVRMGLPGVKPPRIMGRMLAGRVLEVGAAVERVGVGDRVVVDPDASCGTCVNCRRLLHRDCTAKVGLDPGGMVELCRVPEALLGGLFHVPDELSTAAAAYTETVACVAQSVLDGGVAFGDSVVVLGGGGVGLCHIPMARLRGATQVAVAGNHDEALATATEMGAATIDVRTENVRRRVDEITGGRGADVVVEAVGRSETYELAASLTRTGGRVVAFGGMPCERTSLLSFGDVHYRSVSIVGSHQYVPALFERSLDLLAMGAVDLGPILTHQLPLSEAARALDVYTSPECRTLSFDATR